MILEDCKNYREKLRECVELYILGKITIEQALRLLESRYKFMLPNKQTVLPSKYRANADKFFELLKTDTDDDDELRIWEREIENVTGLFKEFYDDSVNLDELLSIGYNVLRYTDGIKDLYAYCKKELESLSV